MNAVGVETSGRGALEAVERLRPDLVLLGLRLHDRNGLDVGREILIASPGTRVVALTEPEDPATAEEAIRSGFTTFITKGVDVTRFANAIRSLSSERIVMGPRFGRRIPDRAVGPDRLGRLLTRRELEVLQLLSAGIPSRSIPGRLGVSPNTVRTHVQGILTKLQVHSRLEAVAYATSNGIVSEAS